MNSGVQILLTLAVMVLFAAVVVAPVLGRILAEPRFGPPPCAPCGPAGMPAFPFDSNHFPPPGAAERRPHARGQSRLGQPRLGQPHLGQPHLGQAGPWDAPEDDGETDRLIDIGRVEGRLRAGTVSKINELIDRHPQAAASVVRNWLHRNE